jgi:hypothetical protein
VCGKHRLHAKSDCVQTSLPEPSQGWPKKRRLTRLEAIRNVANNTQRRTKQLQQNNLQLSLAGSDCLSKVSPTGERPNLQTFNQ